MLGSNHMLEYLKKHGINNVATFSDGALLNPVRFPLAAIEMHGAILFADLPGYSELASQVEPAECAAVVSHFFAWFEGEARRHFGGIVEKFIGDEIMVIFPHTECKLMPLQAAMHTARAMLERDPYAFDPKIGIATGPFAVAIVGSEETATVSAIGHTVNLAARCTESIKNPHTVRIATDDIASVKDVFKNDVWEVFSPELFEPKNMPPVLVVDVHRMTEWVPSFDYLKDLKEKVRFARSHGAIRNDG